MHTYLTLEPQANRRERLPVYTFRSIVLTTICLLPMFCLQFFSGDIMHVCGIERHIADEITTYTSYMIISSILLMLEAHIENVFINLGYTKSAAFNSFLTGLGVDVVSTYLLIFRMNLGTKGAAFAQIIVKSARIWCGSVWELDVVLASTFLANSMKSYSIEMR